MKKKATNKLFSKFLKRTSVRDYDNFVFNKKLKQNIVKIINSSPTSLNGHAFSALLIDNQQIKNQLSLLNKYQKQIADCSLFIVFLIDNLTLNFCQQRIQQTIDKYFDNEILLSATVDATIAATMVQDYALDLNLGTCFIGALRYNIPEVQKILNLEKHIIPILGLCLGKIKKENPIKPKLNKTMWNSYCKVDLLTNLNKYNEIMLDYYLNRGINEDFVNHTINHYLKNNQATKNKELDQLNQIIKQYWFKGNNNE